VTTKTKTRTKSKSKAKTRVVQRMRSTAAEKADRHDLYERSVQDPENDVATMARLFKRYRGRDPLSMREDFCGTATLSVQWATSREGRWAVGVDLDVPTLAWGLSHRIEPAPPDVRERVQLIEANVLDGAGPATDIGCALNFSYSVFKTRAEMRRYFAKAREKLTEDGLFILDAWGGWESLKPDHDKRKLDGFVYEWEVERFDPLNNDVVCHIHFSFADGSRIDRAFTYRWRYWSVMELRELLAEAGFSRVHALWERTDEDGEGTGAWFEPRHVDDQELWWTYLVAER
jgi:SAM-dependent methyltransferase